ncbi:hypothetical protein SLS62_001548 [Diatrype stigma]|uniref:Cytochrome P450 n=1 Tax=Diatrype stigma TaxID=117547 RepID=A0AAN9V0G5_9PEZI
MGDIYNSAVKGHETFLKTDLMDFGVGDKGFIWESDPAKRREVAKKLFPAFSNKAIKSKEPTVHKYIDLFIAKMKELGCKGDGVDINEASKRSELLEMFLGSNFFGTVSHVSKKFPLLSIFSIFFISPKVLRAFPKVLKLNSEEVQRRIDNRGKTKHPDYVDFMLPPDANPPTTKKEKIHLEQVAFQLFIAGYDPIQITLNSAIFFLLKEPKIYAKLVKEIRGAFQHYDDINSDALVDLKFLHACVQETLRVHVTTITGLPRISPGANVDGVYVPKGVVCQISSFTAARNPRYFCDPTDFRPQRWLPSDHPETSFTLVERNAL